jgi:GT2 family glycosyltransferase
MIKGEISLILNFYFAMRDAIDKDYKTVLILESDVFLRPDFEERLLKIFGELEKRGEWDYVSLSDGIGTHGECYKGNYMDQTISDPPHSFMFRCTDSMLFRTEIFKKIVGTILPFRDCLDWELNYQFALHRGKGFWAEPHIVEQGTTKWRDITLLPA